MLCRGYEHADRLVREGEGLLKYICVYLGKARLVHYCTPLSTSRMMVSNSF